MEILGGLFDASGFIPRAQCGEWTRGLIWLHNASDFFIWTAYLAIPIVLARFAWRRREELPFSQVFWLFGLFILACGTTHLMDIVLFYNPLYRLAGEVKLITAAASWGTVMALIPIVPRALAMRSPEVLQREIDEREKAEAEVRLLNSELEARVRERTAELEAANRELAQANSDKDELLLREQAARQEAEAANKSKDEFLATLSHELRTPLNAISGWTHLLKTGLLDAATTDEALQTIERSTRLQTRLVEDILDVSRVMAGKLQLSLGPADLARALLDAEAALRLDAQAKSVSLQVEVEEPPCLVSGDTRRLQQIASNLLSNAIKFTPHGGSVTARLQQREGQAILTASDTGEGIKPEFLPHVFERFRQADSSSTRAHGGLGLGLALVRHLVDLHGGAVQAHSDGPGQGATFTVTLPRPQVLSGNSHQAPGLSPGAFCPARQVPSIL